MAEKITTRDKDYSQWYLDIVQRAGLAENSDVRGCMVIKPHGYAIWERMQRALDRMFKDTGHVNAYFPLFIPKSFFAKEEEMAEGFAKECAVVTHYRLKAEKGKGSQPAAKDDKKITTRTDDYSQWYLDIVRRAELADNSDVRGCMVIRPNGYALWENMQRAIDGLFKATGHVNAYFPLFIPKSFLAKEEEMAEGFAKECAVGTHYRLKAEKGKGIVVDPEARLEEELIVRPTSETIIWNTYRDWIHLE